MAKVVDLNIDPDIEDLMLASVKTKKRYYSNSIIDRKIAVGGRQYDKLEGFSHMKKLGIMWRGLTQAQRDLWSSAGANSDITGWQLFVQDMSYRLGLNLPGFPALSLLHQYKVLIFDNSNWYPEFSITQDHLNRRVFFQKNVGQKTARTPVDCTEEFDAPLKIEFNFHTYFEETPEWDYFTFNGESWGEKDGDFYEDWFSFDMPLVSEWAEFSENVFTDSDVIFGYIVNFEGLGLKGTLMADNFNFEHDGQNFARDPFCKDINEKLWSDDEDAIKPDYPAWLGDSDDEDYILGSYYLA